MTKIKLIIISALFLMGAAGCSESFLDQEPENVIPESMIYEDKEKVPPIVSEELWDKVNKELEKKQIGYKNKQRLTVRSNFAYSGKLICKEHNVAYTRSGVKKGRVK